jgi:hypothetical protein
VEVEAPADDQLGVLSQTAAVVREGRLVTVMLGALEALADRWSASPWPEEAGLDALHFTDGSWRTANWVLVLDALNFCFWAEPGEPRWRVEWHGQVHDGYRALAAALTRALDEGHPLWDAEYVARLDAPTLSAILRPVSGDPEIPLFKQRLANAREAGGTLLARYGGRFTTAVEAASHDAVELVRLLAREFPSFDDVAQWHAERVPFYKRAQICVADVSAAFHGWGIGAFQHLEYLTAFADYKLPQLLRQQGVLVYAPKLARHVDGYELIAAGSDSEVEIRAATVWAVELLRRRLVERGLQRLASQIDYRLWAESQYLGAQAQPYHRTRTMYY